MTSTQNWTPEQIRAEMALKRVTMTAIAKRANVSLSQVSRVTDGAVSDNVRRAIAAALGRDVKEIWPEYYLRELVA